MADKRFTIPVAALESFAKEGRIILHPIAGLIPIDYKAIGMLEKLAANVEFQKNFEIMVVPKMER